jgi:hypothetical protein
MSGGSHAGQVNWIRGQNWQIKQEQVIGNNEECAMTVHCDKGVKDERLRIDKWRTEKRLTILRRIFSIRDSRRIRRIEKSYAALQK